MEFLSKLFDTSDFPARWYCGDWTAGHGWLHILSDLGIWSAYFAIPCVLVFFVWRRKDLPFRLIFLLFGAFIVLCGTTHLVEAVLFWWPAYRMAGVFKLVTALVSWTTVIALMQIAPRALVLKSPEELERNVRQRTAELASEREWFRATLASIGDAVITTDAEGRVASMNQAAETLTGWAEQEALGKPRPIVFNLASTEGVERGGDVVQHDLKGGATKGLPKESVLIAKDGKEYSISDSTAPIRNADGTIAGSVLVFRDIGDSIRQQKELRELADRLSEADRHKDEFLAMLSHELRNPLAPIRSGLEIMKMLKDDPQVFEDVRDTMERQTKQLISLVDDLLDVSRIS